MIQDNINLMTKRILIVEDEGILRVGTTLQLISFGYEVVGYFQCGEDAIEKVNDIKPDLILMDIKLAGKINGIETVRQIQKKIDVPIVYLSAYSNNELIEEAETTKPFRYLLKPLDEIELKFTIDMAIDFYEKEKLIKKLRNINNVLYNLNGMVYRYNIKGDGNVNFPSDIFEKITGFKKSDLKNNSKHFLESQILKEDRETVINSLNNSLNSHKPFKINYRIKTKNNQVKTIQEIGKPIIKYKEVIYLDGVILDLS